MTIEQFRLRLIETYKIDKMPPLPLGPKDIRFNDYSYTKWSIKELVDYAKKYLYPEMSGTKQEFCEIVTCFMIMMETFSTYSSDTSYIFRTAYLISADVLNWLEC